jgi:hypothetical protein
MYHSKAKLSIGMLRTHLVMAVLHEGCKEASTARVKLCDILVLAM